MTATENKARYQRFYEEVLNQGNFEIADEVMDANVISHSALPDQKPGLEGFKQAMKMFRQAFPDLKATAEHVIAEEDKVVGHFMVTATHQGEFMGMVPTGKKIRYEEMVIVRFQDRKIVEHWAVADALSMMQQLGAIPE